jgi:hypothetical protein
MNTEKEVFDKYSAELSQAALLIEKGVKFKVPKKSILKYFSKSKEREFTIKQPYGGALDMMCYEFLQTQIDEEALKENPLQEAKFLVTKSTKRFANIIAIAVLDSKWKIKLFKGVLAHYFLWRMTPQKMMELSSILIQVCNFGDFINSIRLTSITRTTAPQNLIEEKQAD